MARVASPELPLSAPHRPVVRLTWRAVTPWAVFAVALALVLLYLVGAEQGAVSVFGGSPWVHEFAHDGRHLLGFPCH